MVKALRNSKNVQPDGQFHGVGVTLTLTLTLCTEVLRRSDDMG